MAIVGIIAASLVSAMQTSTKIMTLTNTQEKAKEIAANQMEYIRGLSYADNYMLAPMPSMFSDFVASINVSFLNTNEQEISITVNNSGGTVFVLTDFRTNY